MLTLMKSVLCEIKIKSLLPKIIEVVIREEEGLSRDVVKHLNRVCLRLYFMIMTFM